MVSGVLHHLIIQMKQLIILAIYLAGLCTYAQKSYSGKVVDQNNQPLAGATIQSKSNTNNAVISGEKGTFKMSLQNNKLLL